MEKILFICLGNIGRSQMAEAFYNYYTRSNASFSAGVNPKTPKIHPKAQPEICEIMKEEGIDLSKKRSKLVTEEMVESANKIFIMCEKKDCPNFLLNSNKVVFWDIEDPYYKKDIRDILKIRDQIRFKIFSII